ncbi:hypothetical protein [Marispirochaeta sp.]|jgi:hypothetical protein|uniref:hypothetical protein n=1 Tax=Marispirochaeta sp. TaxID=2038653 RepID=UPI0029C6C597|nr:hypothetical protein [Marispirochaeta sp.]
MTLGIILLINSLTWILFIVVFRLVHKRTVRPKKLLTEIESELDSLLVEMNGTTDRNIRLIEDSVRRLKEEVAKADKRIRILQGQNQKRDDIPRTDYVHLARKKPLSIEVVEEPVTKAGDSISDSTLATENKSGDTSSRPLDNQTGNSVKEKIIELNKKGIDAKIIAGKVGRPLGEVELIISLSEKTDR